MFSNFERVANKFDTIRLTGAQQTDGGQYVCEARDGSRQLNRSQPVDLVFCSKCQVDYPHQLHNCVSLYPGLHHIAGYEATECVDYSSSTAASTVFTFSPPQLAPP